MVNLVIGLLLKTLGPLGGYKTIIGIALIAAEAALRFWDASHPALAIVAALITGLGLGDKMGKQRADDDAPT